MSSRSEDSEILEIDILEDVLTLEKLAQEEVLSRGAKLENGFEQVGEGWIALTECAVKSKLEQSDSLSPSRFGLYSQREEGEQRWKWSDRDIRRLAERLINERFLNPARRQHALFLSLVTDREGSSVKDIYRLMLQSLTNWLEDLTEASHDENIVSHLRRILFRKYKISISKENGIAANSLEHRKVVKLLVGIMSKESQDWKPLPSTTARGTPRKTKKGPFTMASISKFADEVSAMSPIPNKAQIYEALAMVLPRREGTARYRNEVHRVIFKPLDVSPNANETSSIDEQEKDFEPYETFDKISSANDEALAKAARALLADLTIEEKNVLSEAKLETFSLTAEQNIVSALLAKIRLYAARFWVKENDLLLEAAFYEEEPEKNAN